MRTLTLTLTLPLLLLLAGCQTQATDPHTSRNSLDWAGDYQGVIPCADCEGIDTTVRLAEDGTWQMTMQYLGKPAPTVSRSGTFAWQPDGGTVVLESAGDAPMRYRVEENRLRQLDAQGNPITGPLEEKFVLHKGTAPPAAATSLENTYWKLTQLGGTAVTTSADQREPHFVLNPDGHRVSGSGGCNRMMGGYETSGNKLSFGQMASTRMACLDGGAMELEQAFHDALGRVATWRMDGGTLALSDASGTVVAEFEPRDMR